jgi:hypothetical protein
VADERPPEERPYPAEKARQADIVLRRRGQRALFVAGIAAAFVVAVLIMVFARR